MKIPLNIKKQVIYALEDDNEIMTSALDSDLDKEDKRMNRLLIKKHDKIIDKIRSENALTMEDLTLINDANQIFINDGKNITGKFRNGLKLNAWLQDHIIPTKAIIRRYKELQKEAQERFLDETEFCYILDMLDTEEREEYDNIENKYPHIYKYF